MEFIKVIICIVIWLFNIIQETTEKNLLTPYALKYSMKRRKLWKTGEGGLCCSSSAIQTRLDPSSLLEERSETPIVFVCFFCVVGYPPNWGKRPRYIDR